MGAHRDPMLVLLEQLLDRGFVIENPDIIYEQRLEGDGHDVACDTKFRFVAASIAALPRAVSAVAQRQERMPGWLDRIKHVAVTEVLKHPMQGPIAWLYLHLGMATALLLAVFSRIFGLS